MKHIKDGVVSSGIEPVVLDGLITIALTYQVLGYDPVVTSIEDGKHMPASLHYKKRAFDWRTNTVPATKRPSLKAEVQAALGNDWDVVLESTHLHTEYDPDVKRTVPV